MARRASRRPFAAHIIGGVQHGAGDIGSAIEALVAQQPVEFALHLLVVAVESQPHARVAIEHHDPHAVVYCRVR